jgi:hypothetical protein
MAVNSVYVSLPGWPTAYQGQSFIAAYLVSQAIAKAGDTIAAVPHLAKLGADSAAIITNSMVKTTTLTNTATTPAMVLADLNSCNAVVMT